MNYLKAQIKQDERFINALNELNKTPEEIMEEGDRTGNDYEPKHQDIGRDDAENDEIEY